MSTSMVHMYADESLLWQSVHNDMVNALWPNFHSALTFSSQIRIDPSLWNIQTRNQGAKANNLSLQEP